MPRDIFVVIPARNEAIHIGAVLKETRRFCRNIIVVDDGSQDQTFQVARQHKATVLRHPINLGKGGALKTGCEASLQSGAKIIVLMDSDGQHRAEDIPRLIHGIKQDKYDIIFGMRRLNRSMPFSMLAGNKLFSLAIAYLYNFKLTDTQCGMRAFCASAYPKIIWKSSAYDVETEMILNALKNHLRCGAIYIDTIYHDKYKGTTILDGIQVMGKIIGKRFF